MREFDFGGLYNYAVEHTFLNRLPLGIVAEDSYIEGSVRTGDFTIAQVARAYVGHEYGISYSDKVLIRVFKDPVTHSMRVVLSWYDGAMIPRVMGEAVLKEFSEMADELIRDEGNGEIFETALGIEEDEE